MQKKRIERIKRNLARCMLFHFWKTKKNRYFFKSKKAVDYYIDGLPLKDIVDDTRISKTEIIRFVKKCIEYDQDV